MPVRLPWTTGVDDVVLRYLEETDIVFTPRILYDNLERDLTDPETPSYSQVSRRVRTLRKAGLLDYHAGESGKYVLGDLGRRYLEDELEEREREWLASIDPEELDDRDERDDPILD